MEAAVGAGTVKAGASLDRPAMFPGCGPQRAGGSSRVGLVSQAAPPLTLLIPPRGDETALLTASLGPGWEQTR